LGDDQARASAPRYDREREWVRAAAKLQIPILGICHGAQLLAHLYGGRLTAPNGSDIIDEGLGELALTNAGRHDPVMQHIPPGGKVYQYHCESFILPLGSIDLASSANSAQPHSDAFRIGSNIYGLQFHPELTAEKLREWLKLPRTDETVEWVARTGREVLDAWVRLALA
jgi:GMP synthase (glutamine-hydrolysing)